MAWRARALVPHAIPCSETMVSVGVKFALGGGVGGTEEAARGAEQSSLACFCWVLGLRLVEVNQAKLRSGFFFLVQALTAVHTDCTHDPSYLFQLLFADELNQIPWANI